MVSRNQRRASELLETGHAACAELDLPGAERAFAKSLELVPNNPGGLIGMAKVAWARRHDAPAARAYYDAAIAAAPDNVESRLARGSFLSTVGAGDAASDDAFYVLSKQPKNIKAYKILHLSRKLKYDDFHFHEIIRLSRSGALSDADRSRAHFILAALYEKNGKYDDAFTHYRIANDFKISVSDYRKTAFYKTFTNRAIHGLAPLPETAAGEDEPRMIFIVGMPRSGSTLLEQLLTTRPGVGSVGEGAFFRRHWRSTVNACFGDRICSTSDPHKLAAYLTPARLRDLRQSYIDDIKNTVPSKKNKIIVDKQLDNFDAIPILAAMFPSARILHTFRHPLDTCISCYAQDFTNIIYSTRLPILGLAYRFYYEVMQEWRKLDLPQLLDVNYEKLALDPAAEIPKILEHCDLPFDTTALDPTASDNVVRTASHAQVRNAIYRSSVGRWRHYASELGPLVYALGGRDWVNAHAPTVDATD